VDFEAGGGVLDVITAAIDDQECRTLSWIPADVVSAVAVDLAFGGVDAPINYCLMMGLNDGDEALELINGLLHKHGLHWMRKHQRFEAYEVFELSVIPGMALYYAVTDDLLVASLAPDLVRSVLRRKSGSEPHSLASSAEFLKVRAGLPEGETIVTYARAADAYKSILAVLTTLQRTGDWQLFDGLDQCALNDLVANLLSDLPIPGPELIDRHIQGAELSLVALNSDGLELYSAAP
jgi:hypothetical protein